MLKGFRPDGAWISDKLASIISPEQAEQSFRLLEKAGFIAQSSGGKWELTEPFLDTGLENFPHTKMQEVHSAILKAWAKNLSRLNPEHQELGVLNIPIRSDLIKPMQTKIRNFQDELIGWLEAENQVEPDSMVQLGTYLIELSEKA